VPPQTRPTVTVLMPVLNGERYVREAVDSILRQSWSDFEFVIVDDGSTDATPRILQSFDDARIRILTNRSREGIAKALNRGLAAATGDFIARHDADDVAHPARLATELAFLRANPDVALVGTQVRVIDEHGRASNPPGWWRALSDDGIRFQSMFDNPFIHSSVMFRREVVWDVLHGYDESFLSYEDAELWSRVAASCSVRNLPEKLVSFRYHAASTAAHYDEGDLPWSSAVIERNLRALLPSADVPERWSHVIGRMVANQDVDAAELLSTIRAIYTAYVASHPDACANDDVSRVMAAKLAQTACLLAPRQRRNALGAFREACGFHLRTASQWATRFIAIFTFGDRARRLRRRR
jgi:glycosyltransferase involved in cell wall biosynthesis